MRVFVCFLFSTILSISSADVPPLSVRGNQLFIGDSPGSLTGNSFYWSNNGWGGERFYNKNVVEWLKYDWNATVVRAAMGIEEYGGYLQDPKSNKARIRAIIDAAIELDMYVIIDWHDHNAFGKLTLAMEFFKEMAFTYGHTNNVIYELWNEPKNDVTWKDNVKPYAETIIKAIRGIDPDNVIVVGSPFWSQDVDVAAEDPIVGYENIVYTLHFYAGTHGQFLRDKAQKALEKNLALFVTEWGCVSADVEGRFAPEETLRWIEFIKAYNISNANWSVVDKVEGSSIIKPGANSDGGWSESDLTQSGKFVRDIIRHWYD